MSIVQHKTPAICEGFTLGSSHEAPRRHTARLKTFEIEQAYLCQFQASQASGRLQNTRDTSSSMELLHHLENPLELEFDAELSPYTLSAKEFPLHDEILAKEIKLVHGGFFLGFPKRKFETVHEMRTAKINQRMIPILTLFNGEFESTIYPEVVEFFNNILKVSIGKQGVPICVFDFIYPY